MLSVELRMAFYCIVLKNNNKKKKFTEPAKGISYPVGDLYRYFTKLTGPSAYTLLITDGINSFL